MCEHLSALEQELHAAGIKETYRGQPWTMNCREWIYFDCVLDLKKIRQRYNFPAFIADHINNDMRSGLETGFECTLCMDAIMGLNSSSATNKMVFN